MARPNPKNVMLTPAATDLGLQDSMIAAEQRQEEEEATRKKIAQAQGIDVSQPAGLATVSLLGGMSGVH